MKAYVIEQAGGPEALQLRDIAAVEPGGDEVQIRVRAFGLNRAEVYRRAGKMGPISGRVVPGIEAVGEMIHDPAGVYRTGQRVGTAMGGMQFSRHGSYAEQVTVLRSNVIPLDGSKLSWEELAALPEPYLTTWGALDKSLAIRAGQTLRDTVKALSSFGGVSVIAPLGGPPVLAQFHLMQDLPGAVRLNFFPSGLLGTPAMPLSESPLPWIAQEVAAGRMPSLRTQTFDFDDVRRAHCVMESDRALGKLVVRL